MRTAYNLLFGITNKLVKNYWDTTVRKKGNAYCTYLVTVFAFLEMRIILYGSWHA